MLKPIRIPVTEVLNIGGCNIPIAVLSPAAVKLVGHNVTLALVDESGNGVALTARGDIVPYTLPNLIVIDHPESE